MTIGDNIRFYRKQIHMTQKELSELTGVNIATIRGYEAGQYKPKLDTVIKLSKALDCDITELLEEPLPSLFPQTIEEEKIDFSRCDKILSQIKNGGEIDASDLYFLYDTCILERYVKLNSDGQKQANKMIADLLDNMEMLTKIPEYQVNENEDTSNSKEGKCYD